MVFVPGLNQCACQGPGPSPTIKPAPSQYQKYSRIGPTPMVPLKKIDAVSFRQMVGGASIDATGRLVTYTWMLSFFDSHTLKRWFTYQTKIPAESVRGVGALGNSMPPAV